MTGRFVKGTGFFFFLLLLLLREFVVAIFE
jgi:hypothetical protein